MLLVASWSKTPEVQGDELERKFGSRSLRLIAHFDVSTPSPAHGRGTG